MTAPSQVPEFNLSEADLKPRVNRADRDGIRDALAYPVNEPMPGIERAMITAAYISHVSFGVNLSFFPADAAERFARCVYALQKEGR